MVLPLEGQPTRMTSGMGTRVCAALVREARVSQMQPPLVARLSRLPLCSFLPSLPPLTRSFAMDVEKRPVLRFKRLTDNAFPPTKGSKSAAGFDLVR